MDDVGIIGWFAQSQDEDFIMLNVAGYYKASVFLTEKGNTVSVGMNVFQSLSPQNHLSDGVKLLLGTNVLM